MTDTRAALEAVAAELGVEAQDKTDDELRQAIEAAQAAGDPAANPPAEQDPRSTDELKARARELDVSGRSSMNRDELIAAIADAEGAGDAPRPGTPEEVGRPPLGEVAEQSFAEREARTRHYGIDPDSQE